MKFDARSAGIAAAAASIALAVPFVREFLERDMARHMLVEIPVVMAIGAVACGHSRRLEAAWARVDRLGIAGWLLASLVTGFWMIPAALDAALAIPAMNAAKFASIAAAGFALRSAWRRSPPMLEAFFVGNFAWMAATVGLIYRDAEAQLCLAYLADEQQRAGSGLVALAVASGIAWIALRARRFRLLEATA